MSQLENQMRHRDKEMVPSILVKGMFALMIASTGIVAYAQWTNKPQVGVVVEAPIVQSASFVLTGDRTGIYSVTDASGAQVALSSDHKAGFIGVIGRVIDRERQLLGMPSEDPIQVVRRTNGNIAILDATTGMTVELIGYGADNVAAFAALLD